MIQTQRMVARALCSFAMPREKLTGALHKKTAEDGHAFPRSWTLATAYYGE